MSRQLSLSDLPDDVARFAEAQMATGRFASVDEVLRASMKALASQQRNAREALIAAGEEGLASLREHGPQLESDEEFTAFLDQAEADAQRP